MLLPILVFFCVTFGIAGLALWLLPTRSEQRLQAVAGPVGETHWTETAVRIVGPFANLSTPSGNWENSPLRLRFLHAGLRDADVRLVYFGAKALLPLALAPLAYMGLVAMGEKDTFFFLAYSLAVALIGYYIPNAFLAMRIRKRQREIFENFPDAADLLLVCVEAGLGLDGAMTRVADEMRRKSRALAEELHLTNLELRAGSSRETALRNMALRTGIDETATFATMLSQADRFGTSVGDSLRVFSDELRHKRQIRAEERAAKIPTKLLLPLILFIFPSVIMVVMGPAVIQMVRTIGPMLAGQR
jgi:tight adherence protein C